MSVGLEPIISSNFQHWADGYIKVANENKIIDINTFNKNNLTTRIEMAEMIAKVLNINTNQDTKSYFLDTNNIYVEKLYEIGIVNGVEEKSGFYFRPNNPITRAETSALIIRVIDYFTKNQVENIVNDNILYDIIISKPTTVDLNNVLDIENLFVYLSRNSILSYDINHSETLDDESFKTIMNNIETAFLNSCGKYPEYLSFFSYLNYSIKTTGYNSVINIELTPNEFVGDSLASIQEYFITKTKEVLNGLIDEGRLTAQMTEKEKARVLYEWMALNTSYDTSYKSESFTGYGVVKYGTAVCQGYTSMYNLMLKMLGISAQGIVGEAGESHIWTLATLDGERVHIDSTFGDPIPDTKGYCNFDYFARTAEFMKQTHSWDENIYK